MTPIQAPTHRGDERAEWRRGGFWTPWSPPAAQARCRPRPPGRRRHCWKRSRTALRAPCPQEAARYSSTRAPGWGPAAPPSAFGAWRSAPGGVRGGAAPGGAPAPELTRPPQRRLGPTSLRRLRPGSAASGGRAGWARHWTFPSSRGRACTEGVGGPNGPRRAVREAGGLEEGEPPSWALHPSGGTGVR